MRIYELHVQALIIILLRWCQKIK